MTEDENNLNGGRWVAYFKYETESLKKLENYWLQIVSFYFISKIIMTKRSFTFSSTDFFLLLKLQF
jgi:hypothetical protein